MRVEVVEEVVWEVSTRSMPYTSIARYWWSYYCSSSPLLEVVLVG